MNTEYELNGELNTRASCKPLWKDEWKDTQGTERIKMVDDRNRSPYAEMKRRADNREEWRVAS